MARYARLVGGQWRVTFASGETASHAWRWGPGRHSLHKTAAHSAMPDTPWAGDVMYWHPGRKQVWQLSMHEDIPAVGRGVGEGTFTFDGQTGYGPLDLYQPRGVRKLASRLVFDGPDRYQEFLLEDSGSGYGPLNEWKFDRVADVPKPRSGAVAAAPLLSDHFKVFQPLLAHAWESTDPVWTVSGRDPGTLRSTFVCIPSLEVVHVRVQNGDANGPIDVLEAYVYRPVRTPEMRCLALSNRAGGGVYEGTVSVIGGGVEMSLTGYEGDRVIPLVVRLEIQNDKTLRTRIWTNHGEKRKLVLESNHVGRALKPPGP